MEQLKKLAIDLGHTVYVINDEVYIKTSDKGYVNFEPLGCNALEIEEKFNLTTSYMESDTLGTDNCWITDGKLCSYSANTPAQARLNAALSFLED